MTNRIRYLRNGTIIPDIPSVWEDIIDKSNFPFFNILFDGIELVLFIYLQQKKYPNINIVNKWIRYQAMQRRKLKEKNDFVGFNIPPS